MNNKLRPFLLVVATAIFSTVAFASAMPVGPQDVGSMTMEQQPLLLAKSSKGSIKSKGSNKGSVKVYVYYCKVKPAKGSKPAKYKTKKGKEPKVLQKIANKPDKYFLGKCEDIFSLS